MENILDEHSEFINKMFNACLANVFKISIVVFLLLKRKTYIYECQNGFYNWNLKMNKGNKFYNNILRCIFRFFMLPFVDF